MALRRPPASFHKKGHKARKGHSMADEKKPEFKIVPKPSPSPLDAKIAEVEKAAADAVKEMESLSKTVQQLQARQQEIMATLHRCNGALIVLKEMQADAAKDFNQEPPDKAKE